jgi:hypothetical protein
VPLEVVRALSAWLAILETRGTAPGSSLGSMIGCLETFEDSLSGGWACFLGRTVADEKGCSPGEDLDDTIAFVS